ncbi:site-specific DNA-methyltransferase [Francisella tularensis subsp. novicida]|uniref:site-specific DNA-methyltransferase (adenine-specific) n=3 Tax=Francisella tularensis TaxID=263 RepID=A0A6I4RR82_FRATU|nr:site-specific DNA-methyltransferase [Francisella tularensis]ABK90358.1 adenine specific DNA methylase [Francisella tularensis subsp. novicida U112]AJI60601.1 DNA methylase family protein [Francisella tularensis subsp. novicida U112]EDX20131.1 DNA methylase domain protein [Francisella tularensis subsp. novicida FTE]MBK2035956.1 site-specific DNA-methyltransferase [Francisella tularensis subsp. novicida]MBK2116597.1 site-specific DNA-methyltransferase [Francisella tularensis subsp. novicida]
MINKSQVEQNNLKILDSSQVLQNDKDQIIAKLKELLPNVINSDNQLNTQALQDVLDIANTTSNNQGYELTFAGKGIAKAKADEPTIKELKAELEQSKDFDNTENVVIRGDNIDTLKILRANYTNKIKMIYIDPPYNTKSENFVYNDNFKKNEEELIKEFGLAEETQNFLTNVYGTRSHSGWLSFMYPRLKIARELLKEDGVIFISIDDNEQANLKIICDEIFGEENFVACLPTIMNLKGNHDNYGFAETHEYIFVYVIDKNICEINKFDVDESELEKWQEDDYGLWKEADTLKRTGQDASRINRPKGYFPVFIDKNEKIYVTENDLPENRNDTIIYPVNDNGDELSWSWGKRKIMQENYNLILKKTSNGFSIYKKQRPGIGDLPTKKAKSFLYKTEYSSTTATNYLKKEFGKKIFDNPKPLPLLKDLIILGLNSNDVILDFFAGSGTTGDAVMQLNAEDGGKRKYILAQLDEPIDEKKEAYKFCTDKNFEPVISSITIERLNRAGEKIKADIQAEFDAENSKKKPNQEKLAELQEKLENISKLDIGYKVFSLKDKPCIAEVTNDGGQVSFVPKNLREKTLDTLANMLCATCKPLHTKIETLITDKLYKAGNEIYLLGSVDKSQLEIFKDLKINVDGYSDLDLEDFLNLGVTDKDNVSVVY